MTEDLALPHFHLGGSSPRVILDDLMVARRVLPDAILAVRQTGPNARDYIGHADELARAQVQHGARMQRLEDVLAELYVLAHHASDHLKD